MAARLTTDVDTWTLAGDVDHQTVPQLYQQVTEIKQQVSLDLSAVEQIDSAGVALLVYWAQLAEKTNGGITLTNPGKQLLALADILLVNDVLGLA